MFRAVVVTILVVLGSTVGVGFGGAMHVQSPASGETGAQVLELRQTDTTAPTITNFSASNASGKVQVSFTSDEKLETVDVIIDPPSGPGVSLGLSSMNVTGSGPYHYTGVWENTPDITGNYSATLVTAADAAGNNGAEDQTAYVYLDKGDDTTAPNITNFTARNASGKVQVSFTSDEELALADVIIMPPSGPGVSLGLRELTKTGDGPYTYTGVWENTPDINGEYTATLDSAVDAAGNNGATGQTDTVRIQTGGDTDPPVISNFTLTNVNDHPHVSFTSSERLATIDVIIMPPSGPGVSLGRFELTESGDGPYTYSGTWTDHPAIDGTYTAELATAVDAAGNNGASFQQEPIDIDVGPDGEPPVIDDIANQTIDEGDQLTRTITWSDPDSANWNISIAYGDGTTQRISRTQPSLRLTHQYRENGTYPVSIRISDAENASSSAAFSVHVGSVPPTVTVNATSVTVAEGETARVSGTVSDPGVDSIDLTATTGTITRPTNNTWTWTFNTTDGPDQSQRITIQATDDDGGANASRFDLTVTNVPPTVTLDLQASGIEDTPLPLDAVIEDPGTQDTHTATVDWGDATRASVPVDQAANTLTTTHSYATGGIYTVSLTVTDDDNGTTTEAATTTITHIVSMDVKPDNGDATDPLTTTQNGVVPVVIQTTTEFDATTVNVSSLRFGAPDTIEAGGGATPVHDGHLEDIDADGDLDLIVHLRGETGLDTNDDHVNITGQTTTAVPLTGTDSIRVIDTNDQSDTTRGKNTTPNPRARPGH